jgi:hypothetical protein
MVNPVSVRVEMVDRVVELLSNPMGVIVLVQETQAVIAL